MPKVIYGDVIIECATAEEAAQVARSLGDGRGVPIERPLSPEIGGQISSRWTETRLNEFYSPEIGGQISSRWTETRLNEFYRLIKGQQRKILDALLDSPDGRTDKQLLQMLGWDNGRMLAGVLSGLAKNSKKAGVGGHELYTKRHVTVGDEGMNEYKITDSFRVAVGKYRK